MADCCEDKACEVAALRQDHARVLWVVLGINFVGVAIAVLFLRSAVSVLRDSLAELRSPAA